MMFPAPNCIDLGEHILKRQIMPIFWWGFSKLPVEQRRKILYRKWVGHNLPANPTSFTEKIQWRIIKDRRELIARGGDKLSMKLHASVADPKILIPETLWFGEDLETIYDRDFGVDWVLKPITGSGHNAFGTGSMRSSNINLAGVRAWNAETLSAVHGEWAYSQARPGYLVEKRIETANGESPHDYRFFVFRGEVRMIQIDSPRSSTVYRRFYTPDWTPLDVQQGDKPLADPVPAPDELPMLLEAASRIGAEFDFMRVDLYTALGQIYFGEITPYPTGGLAPFSDPAFDEQLGSYWDLAVMPSPDAVRHLPKVIRKGDIVQAPSGKVFMGAGWVFADGRTPPEDLAADLAARYPETVVKAPDWTDAF